MSEMYDFIGAKVVAGVFLVTAAVIVAGTVLCLLIYLFAGHLQLHNPTSSSSSDAKGVVVVAAIAGSILVASWVAFFGYVVLLLIAVHRGVQRLERAAKLPI